MSSSFPRAAGIGKHVLVADDEPHTRVALSLVLRKAGFRVTVVEDGLQALRSYVSAVRRSTPFDLLIIDIQMPGLTGIELAEEIGKLGSAAPILLITGYRDTDSLAELSRRHCVECAEKPFDPAELLQHVSRLLARREGAQRRPQPSDLSVGGRRARRAADE